MENATPAVNGEAFDLKDAQARAAKMISSVQLQAIDTTLQESQLPAMKQMGVVLLAAALCFQRVLTEQKVTDRGRRKKLQRLAMEELGLKISKYGFKSVDELKKDMSDNATTL